MARPDGRGLQPPISNPFRRRVEAAGGISLPPWTGYEDWEKRRIQYANQQRGTLEGYDCPECLNRGYFLVLEPDGSRRTRECRCMARRRSMQSLARSGLAELAKRYTLESWQRESPWQSQALALARGWLASGPTGWFYLAGGPGTGKTHLCVGLCARLVESGREVRYAVWRDLTVRAKALVNQPEAYQALVEPLKTVEVLYIDDLFKTGRDQAPTSGDVNLAFELLNARYNRPSCVTLLSSQWNINGLLELDEALGSRIYERSRGFYLDFTGRPNHRLLS